MSPSGFVAERVLGSVPLMILAVILIPWYIAIVRWVWNRLVPDIFGWKKISYWQALGLIVLSYLLLGIPSSW